MSNIRNLFLIFIIFIFNSCDSGSSTTPSAPATESVVTISLNGISNSSFDQNSFITSLASQLGINSNRITILGVTERNLDVELYFSDPSEGEPDTATLLLDVVEISTIIIDGTSYNMTAEINEVATDCAGVPGGTTTTDTCGVCGGDSSSCASNNLIDLLQGEWTITGQCITGDLYDENSNVCSAYDDCEEFNDGTYALVNGNNFTFCDGGTDCETVSFTLNGNTMIAPNPYYGGSISQTITLSNNNLTATASSTNNYSGCTATIIETWQKNLNYTPIVCGSTVELFGQIYNVNSTIYLDFEDNQIVADIPSEIGCLRNLIELDLEDNQLYGVIPPELGNLTNLQYLDLENNMLSGNIPNSVKELIHQINSIGGYTSLIENDYLNEIDWIDENACGECMYP